MWMVLVVIPFPVGPQKKVVLTAKMKMFLSVTLFDEEGLMLRL